MLSYIDVSFVCVRKEEKLAWEYFNLGVVFLIIKKKPLEKYMLVESCMLLCLRASASVDYWR